MPNLPALDVAAVRTQFPILERSVRGRPLVYLDSGATSQKPLCVLDAERDYYLQSNAAVHRGAHALAEEATEAYESARVTIASFVGARAQDLVFTTNATAALNLASYAFSNATALAARGHRVDPRFVIGEGDSIVVTEMEHHANLIPWQQVCEKTGATLRWIGLSDDGRLDLRNLDSIIDQTTKVVSLSHQSNILGTINPVAQIMEAAHSVNAIGVVDACQSIPHMPVDVHDLGADLIAWSGHKMLGPTGIGFLWGSTEILNAMTPFQTGGSMIETVTMERSTFATPPQRFEAGTQMVAQAIGTAAAVRYLESVGMVEIAAHEHALTAHALAGISQLPGVRVIGPTDTHMRGSAISFVVDGLHPHDVGQVMDAQGVAVRVGHHCAWPTCRRFSVPATTRISPYLYNTLDEIDAGLAAIAAAQEFFQVVN